MENLKMKNSNEQIKEEVDCVINTFIRLGSILDPNFNIQDIPNYKQQIIDKVKEKYPNISTELLTKYLQVNYKI